VSVEKDGILFL